MNGPRIVLVIIIVLLLLFVILWVSVPPRTRTPHSTPPPTPPRTIDRTITPTPVAMTNWALFALFAIPFVAAFFVYRLEKSTAHTAPEKSTAPTARKKSAPPRGYVVREVVGDGNCMFRALAVAMGEAQDNHGKYRKMAVEALGKYRNHEILKDIKLSDLTKDFNNHIEAMKKEREWGTELELFALAHHLNRRIHVISAITDTEDTVYGPERAEPIYLQYYRQLHYNAYTKS